jgi:hypothetical protein
MSQTTKVYFDHDIEKPLLKDEKWLIFNNTIFSHIETFDCNDTIEGRCYKSKTFDECVKICNDNPYCEFGYYVSTTNGNLCVPIRDFNKNINPIHRLRNKNIYKEFEDINVKTFINKDIYHFPPVDVNTVFYLDKFIIQNVETSTVLKTSPFTNENSKQLKFDKDGGIIMHTRHISSFSVEKYIKLKYGDKFFFNLPNTNIAIKESENSDTNIEWGTRFTTTENIIFYLEPLTKDKKIGDTVSYTDTFIIRADPYYMLGISSTNLLQKQIKPDNSTFRFIPKMIGFYCNNDNKCTEVPFEEMEVNDKGIATKNGLDIGRNPGCWGVCKYKVQNQQRLKTFDVYKNTFNIKLFIFFFITLLILVIIIFIFKK